MLPCQPSLKNLDNFSKKRGCIESDSEELAAAGFSFKGAGKGIASEDRKHTLVRSLMVSFILLNALMLSLCRLPPCSPSALVGFFSWFLHSSSSARRRLLTSLTCCLQSGKELRPPPQKNAKDKTNKQPWFKKNLKKSCTSQKISNS